jgi:hypothetical protein
VLGDQGARHAADLRDASQRQRAKARRTSDAAGERKLRDFARQRPGGFVKENQNPFRAWHVGVEAGMTAEIEPLAPALNRSSAVVQGSA